MARKDTPLQRRDHGEYSEGPLVEDVDAHSFTCEECGRTFECVDTDARKCSKCLWRELKGEF